MPDVPPAAFGRPVTTPGDTSLAWDRLSTSRVTASVPPASLVTSMPLPAPETLVNAQPVGALDQFDHVSAAPEVGKVELDPAKLTLPDHVPQPAKSATVAVHVPAAGFLTVIVSAPPGPPESTGPVLEPWGSVIFSLQSPTRSLATLTVISRLFALSSTVNW